jgi:LPXTG-motif cell wall-anchored protein
LFSHFLSEPIHQATDTEVTATPKTISGYAYYPSHKKTVSKGVIAGDGRLVLKLYYKVDKDGDGTADDEQKYTITFTDDKGNVITKDKVLYGKIPIEPKAPKKSGYVFKGWKLEIKVVTGDAIYKATYSKITYDIEDEDGNPVKPKDPLDDPKPGDTFKDKHGNTYKIISVGDPDPETGESEIIVRKISGDSHNGKKSPKTGDANSVMLFTSILLLSLAILAMLIMAYKRRRGNGTDSKTMK